MLTQLRRDIAHAWAGSVSWPGGLTPQEASDVRDLVQAACNGALDIFDSLESESAPGGQRSSAVFEPQRAAMSFWEESVSLTGGEGWKRIVIWTALAVRYLARLADSHWPLSVRDWLTAADETLQQSLSPSMVVEIAGAIGRSEKPLPDELIFPLLAAPVLPQLSRSIRPGALAEIERPRHFRGLETKAVPGEPKAPDRPADDSSMRSPPAVEPEARRYDVWFGTNRAIGNPSRPLEAFTNERDPLGRVHYGSCSVEVPRTHKFGSTGTVWWKRWARFNFQDDHLRLVEIVPFDSGAEFFGELQAQMHQLGAAERQVLVYIHGYNVSFEEAAIRAAQIGFDLKVPGVTSFFSWPSANSVGSYFADQDRIEASENEIAEFLVPMHILAHSMGNRGLARAMQRITAQAARDAAVRFGQIILAAPDISVELFRDLAAVYPTVSERTTMYASARDRALSLSSFLQDGLRAGFTPPTTVVAGVDTIEVTDIDLTMLGHGYYAAAEAVLYDMAQLLHSPLVEAAVRTRLRADRSDAGPFWKIGA
jgi:esterase/lipase superfamily enzyme